MRKKFQKSFDELVNENKENLLRDKDALEEIERKLEDRQVVEDVQHA
ncbi:FbpB family small basic protein [Texcoconibacillus texcoconensis]|uniref:FbpB family small basic protein n=1 Tax=Texcoconibacillus texcoconensis TaxID=1095777 RepID=A0A840QT12_9BACI|nr:FbpB family small basic protein [Texcoconibacillus texcoconensis]MBB5174676.1 hypothetical protein [Texcoconibacillus texcoconensis]